MIRKKACLTDKERNRRAERERADTAERQADKYSTYINSRVRNRRAERERADMPERQADKFINRQIYGQVGTETRVLKVFVKMPNLGKKISQKPNK